MRTLENQKRNTETINQLRTINFNTKEKVYASLIIDVLEVSNNLSLKLQNCVVENNLIEQMLYDEYLSFISDEFGRQDSELGEEFINACKRLNEEFNTNFPKPRDMYFTKKFSKTRNFMQKLILRLVNPLELKRVEQKYFTSVNYWDESKRIICIRWTTGTKRGSNFLNEHFTLQNVATKKELKKVEKEINTFLDHCDDENCDKIFAEVFNIIEKSIPLDKD